jgi:hypothetical protein
VREREGGEKKRRTSSPNSLDPHVSTTPASAITSEYEGTMLLNSEER